MVDPESKVQTAEAAAWLVKLAKLSVDADDSVDSRIVVWLTRLASLCGPAPVRDWSFQGALDRDVLNRTVDACAWLYPIAEQSVALGWNPSIVDWLERFGSAAHSGLKEGLH